MRAKKLTAAEKSEQLNKMKMLEQLSALEIAIDQIDKPELALALEKSSVLPPNRPEKTKYNPDQIVDVVTFAEHPYYCKMKLHPWQKLVLKLFYMGNEGNAELKIDDEKPEKGCGGCVWNYSRITEEEAAESFKNGDIAPKKSMLPVENSPCLTCSRFNKNIRKTRFEALRDQATSLSEENKYNRIEKTPTQDNHTNEMDLLCNPEFNPEIRKQVDSKLGNKFQELVLVCGRRSGKLLDICLPILTTKGWSTMGQLKVGDYVFAPDGSPTKIIAKSDIDYDEQAYEMHFSNSDVIIAGANHEWVTLTKPQRKNVSRGKHSKDPIPQIFTTEQIANSLTWGKPRLMLEKGSKTERRNKTTIETNHAIEVTKSLLYPENNDIKIHPYLVGAWLGDGSKHSSVIAGIDLEIFDYIEKNCNHKISHYKCPKSHGVLLNVQTGESFVSLLKQENLYGNKHIPRKYLENSIENRLELLRGLNDTDGFCRPDNHTIEFCNTNKQIAYDYYELVCGLGFKASIKESDATLYGRITSRRWRITYSVPPGTKVFNLSRKQLVLDNKTTKDKSDKYRIFIKDCIPVKNPGCVCIQVDHPSHMYLCGRSLIPTHNSFLTTICSLYETYKLLEMKNPHKRYNLMDTEPIGILNVASSAEQAKNAIFSKIKGIVFESPYFIEKIGAQPLETEIFFLTEQNIEDNKKRSLQNLPPIPGGIIIRCGHSNANSLVGGTYWCVLMDEVAGMTSADGSMVQGIDYKLYEDLAPTRATFGRDGKFFILSQPKGAKGLLFDLYQNRRITPSTLILQLPTWLINPSIELDWLEEEKSKDLKTFAMQYGAIFGATEAESWIDYDLIEPAFNYPTPRIEQSTNIGFSYFCHIDPSHTLDYYTIVVGHSVPSMRPNDIPDVYIDHIHYWKPSSNKPINVELVEEYVINLHKKFRFKQVSYDQWNSQSSIQKLQNSGINAICRPFTKSHKEAIYDQLYQLFIQNKIFIYTYNTTVIDPSTNQNVQLQEIDLLKSQFKTLQKKFNGKNYRVEAMSGAHDDIPDAIAAVCFEILTAKFTARPFPRPITVYTP